MVRESKEASVSTIKAKEENEGKGIIIFITFTEETSFLKKKEENEGKGIIIFITFTEETSFLKKKKKKNLNNGFSLFTVQNGLQGEQFIFFFIFVGKNWGMDSVDTEAFLGLNKVDGDCFLGGILHNSTIIIITPSQNEVNEWNHQTLCIVKWLM